MSNVIYLTSAIKTKSEQTYKAKIASMDKHSLLEEMVKFQEKRSSVGQLTPEMMYEGVHLFAALENNAETNELKLLCGSYRRHLQYEIAQLEDSYA